MDVWVTDNWMHLPGCILAPKDSKHTELGSDDCKGKQVCHYCLDGFRFLKDKEFIKLMKKYRLTLGADLPYLYVITDKGAWRMQRRKDGLYRLYHRNGGHNVEALTIEGAKNSRYHVQKDVDATKSAVSLIRYIIEHDKAMKIIEDDYRKLPKTTKKQKQYYKAAKARRKRKGLRAVERAFKRIEKKDVS